jgi:P27 family predicted phage terminase small subunit
MPGPKKQPTHLRILGGNAGKRAINKDEPPADNKRPKVPSHLSTIGKNCFNELCDAMEDMGILASYDRKMIELASDSYSEYREARKVVKEKGMSYSTTTQDGSEMFRARPEVAIASDAFKRLRSIIPEFGLTPSSRSKIKVGGAKDVDPMDAFLKKNNQ